MLLSSKYTITLIYMHTCIMHACLAYFWVAIKSAYWSSTPMEGEFSGILSWIARESGLIQQTNEAWGIWRARAHTLILTLSRETRALASKNHTHTHTGQCSMHCDTPPKDRSFLIIMKQPAVWAGAKKTRQKHELDMAACMLYTHTHRKREPAS